jgi:hypothetical protein
MGTRSQIAMQVGKKFLSIYCHWDGYIKHHGPILLNHYNTPEKVKELIALGSLSSLQENIGEKHDFDCRTGNDNKWCTSHVRDRGEDIKPTKLNSLDAVAEHAYECNGEYAYAFTPEGWKFCDLGESNRPWHPLTLAVITQRLTS